MSTPITRPESPTFLAAKKQSNPAPDHKSKTTSPSLISPNPNGLPQPQLLQQPPSAAILP